MKINLLNLGVVRQLVFAFSVLSLIFSTCLQKDIVDPDTVFADSVNSSNALVHYLNNNDSAYNYHQFREPFKEEGVTTYFLELTSQIWQGIPWRHRLFVIVPDDLQYDNALFILSGGKNDTETGDPRGESAENIMLRILRVEARNYKAVTAYLQQVPVQPIFDHKEDGLIALTLRNFLDNGESDYSWPLLFPMTKSGIRGMDAVQDFLKVNKGVVVKDFLVSGGSKRGWVTWLMGATDERVVALAPMVIDILNMPETLGHQQNWYGDFSKEIHEYVDLGIVDQLDNPAVRDVINMIDPYSYREFLDKPKFLFMGTNDNYWVIDNVKYYLPEMPGITLLNYSANTGHDAGTILSSLASLEAFWSITMNKDEYPIINWETEQENGNIHIHINTARNKVKNVRIYSARHSSLKTVDFRKERFDYKKLPVPEGDRFTVVQELPDAENEYVAFYVQVTFDNPLGKELDVCTEAFVANKDGIMTDN